MTAGNAAAPRCGGTRQRHAYGPPPPGGGGRACAQCGAKDPRPDVERRALARAIRRARPDFTPREVAAAVRAVELLLGAARDRAHRAAGIPAPEPYRPLERRRRAAHLVHQLYGTTQERRS